MRRQRRRRRIMAKVITSGKEGVIVIQFRDVQSIAFLVVDVVTAIAFLRVSTIRSGEELG
jgi:phosphoribulokinase